MEQNNENRINLQPVLDNVEKIKANIGQVVIGQQFVIDLLIIALLSEGHVLIEGVPGLAKTLTAKLLAKSIDHDFNRIQFTPDLMPSDITGSMIYNNSNNQFEFRKGPIFAGIILADEINRSPAKTQAALFEAMEERQVSVEGTTHPLPDPFIVIATQNPIEQEGTYRLPEAQLDRFIFKVVIKYPTLEEEIQLLKNENVRKSVPQLANIHAVLNAKELIDIRTIIQTVYIDEKLIQYAAKIVDTTRRHPSLYLGASPRASIAILKSAKACAGIRGRDFVTPDDIKFVTPHILRHRIILSPEKEMEGQDADNVIIEILNTIEVPR
jgi:MoxR-like ATPase